MAFRDIITNRQKVVQVFTEDEVEEILSDDNHRQVLQFLFKGPLTIEELEIAFKKSGNDKSDKSIYRYLGKLKKAGLVIEAGKRIFSDQANQIKTQTLFARVAKIIFAPIRFYDKDESIERRSLILVNEILKERLELKDSADLDCLRTKMDVIYKQKNAVTKDFFENVENDSILDLIQDFEIYDLYPILDFTGWILLFDKHPEFYNELKKCFK
ncbi:MAG: winged helix-turn-helix transcriptional regulator [Asgard group archaeon]|nr:winged helix-turn-helix transcriptional regulator [Asgard group archaeon]